MSLIDLALMPIRVGLGITDAVLHAVTPASPAPPSELLVVDGMPEGVPAAARRPEPALPAPAGWPFGEEFPRTCGTSRFAGGAVFWTDFLYDDHGATGVLVDIPTGGLVPPRGTYVYPAGPAARNGADIFRVAVGLTETDTWWRVDWNTLLDPSVPIALFTFDTDRGQAATDQWPAGAGVRSAGIDLALLVSAAGARLIDLTTHASTPVEHTVDLESRSFLARIPRSSVEPAGTWTVRLAVRAGQRRGRRVRRGSLHPRRAARAAQRLQHRLPQARAGDGTPELLVGQGAGRRPHRRGRVPVFAGRPVGSTCRSPHHR